MNIKRQKAKTDWNDEAGKVIPWSSIKQSEKVYEKEVYAIAKAAIVTNKNIAKLKVFIQSAIDKCIDAFHKDYKGKKSEFKGNYTIRNFNDTIKVEVSISNPIKFDDLTIQLAKKLLDEFLMDGITSDKAVVKEMVLDAFSTKRGKLDVDKVLGLKRYSDRVDDKRWTKAMSLIDAAIRRPTTAKYYRVSVKDENGKYQNIPLALANV